MTDIDPNSIRDEVLTTLVEQLEQIADPLGRLTVLDALSKATPTALIELMVDAAAEYREGGGTWREIGEHLGVTMQSAYGRFDPKGRQRNVEKLRRRTSAERESRTAAGESS